MREVADQVFHIFAIAIILGFALAGFLDTKGVFDKWRERYSRYL